MSLSFLPALSYVNGVKAMFDVTLSFDNGPERAVTPGVLDTLRREDVRATFFVIGTKLLAARELAVRAHAEGHWLGNHTWSHTTPMGLRAEANAAELEIGRTEIALADLRHPDRLFRPFAGKGRGGVLGPTLLSPLTVAYLERGRFTCVLWNVIAREWERPDDWVPPAVDLCAAQQHALIVLHDLPNGAMDRLPAFIDAVRKRGGRFRQDFPASAISITRGVRTQRLDDFMPSSPSVA